MTAGFSVESGDLLREIQDSSFITEWQVVDLRSDGVTEAVTDHLNDVIHDKTTQEAAQVHLFTRLVY